MLDRVCRSHNFRNLFGAALHRFTMASVLQPAVQGSVTDNGLAIIHLDRPKALNAMNLEMDVAFKHHLDEWAVNVAVKGVLVESSSGRAFSAGMDVKSLAAAVQTDINTPLVSKMFGAEYSLICKIAGFQKPYISFMDGICMGFGIGLSGHGRYRVVTERTLLAMPENGIGLFPDVGFSHIAARSPGEGAMGAYLGLTGFGINNPADALYVGSGTHFVPSAKLPSLKQALLQQDLTHDADQAVGDVLGHFSEKPELEAPLKNLLPSIVSCFGDGKTVMDSIEALRNEQMSNDPAVAEWATGVLVKLLKSAPFSLCVTQKHFQSISTAMCDPGNILSKIDGVMKAEYRVALRSAVRNDFIEGVRAVVVDKDHNPKWKPASLAEVDPAEVDLSFQPLGDEAELQI